jgi:16S rRNA (guanine527-N7)-methyltransferase
MNDAIEAALEGVHPDARVCAQLERYVELLLEHNTRINLTGARDAVAAADHVRDSLALAPFVREPLVDVGSGGGFPGIPLAIATGFSVTLLDATLKKARFLETVADELGLRVTVLATRAEIAAQDPKFRERFASATARAVGGAPVVMELTLPFLEIGGIAVLQRGRLDYAEWIAAADAALVLGGGLLEEVALERGRRIVLVGKRAPTPERFPRRSGIPEKRPLCRDRREPNGLVRLVPGPAAGGADDRG